MRARAARYRRERWTTPSGETESGALPAGILGGFGPDLQLLALHFRGQVTTDRLTVLLNAAGGIDDNYRRRHIGPACAARRIYDADRRFTTFRTGSSKSRANFLSILRAGSSINAAALDYMRRRGLPEATLTALDGASERNSPTPRLSTHISSR